MGLRWAWQGRGERVQRARAAGPTLTGTLETCVLEAESAPSSE